MRIGFETTSERRGAAAVRSSGVAAAGRRHGTAGQPLPGFPGRMKRLNGCRTCAEERTVPHREESRAFLSFMAIRPAGQVSG
jgi:hypothetical protein